MQIFIKVIFSLCYNKFVGLLSKKKTYPLLILQNIVRWSKGNVKIRHID